MVLDRYLIAKGLVGSFEVVFNEPLGEFAIEYDTVCGHITQRNKFILKRPVESFIEGVVSWCFGAGEILRQSE